MRTFCNFLFFILFLGFLQSCNTLYNIDKVKIEVVEPSRILIPSDYKTVAFKYNNCNVGFNADNLISFIDDQSVNDSINTDSIASEVYYKVFVENLKKQNFFNSIIELEPNDFSAYTFIDSLVQKKDFKNDTLKLDSKFTPNEIVHLFTKLAGPFPDNDRLKSRTKVKLIDAEVGLYSKEELKAIADSTNADALFSFDYYASVDGIRYFPDLFLGLEYVYILAIWNIYDLETLELKYIQPKADTITWDSQVYNSNKAPKLLPPRYDAILNAADIAGFKFAEYLVPHWIEVSRILYASGHVELKKTKKLVQDNKWLEAAEIWKANINNPNKRIAAKSKYNMALVCEINGDLEAALDWVVQSFHTLGPKNQEHYFNCQRYINILSQRMVDNKKIDLQYNYSPI